MTEPISLQSLLGLAPLSPNDSNEPQAIRTPFPFPMQNLALDPLFDQSLAALPTENQSKLSLTPQALASIITNAVIKAVSAVIGMLFEKMLPLLGSKVDGNTSGAEGSTATGSGNAGSTAETPQASAPGSTSTPDTTGATDATSTSPLDGLKNIFKKVTDFFGGKSGLGEFLTDVVTTFIPGGLGVKILTKVKGLGKLFKGMLSLGDSTLGNIVKKGSKLLDSIFPGGTDVVKGLFDKGKKMLKKIF